MNRPVVWSIAGADSGGGAGLSADQRAADAFGVHLCPVVAAVTAQNSRTVARVAPVDQALLDAQLDALARDLPPRAVKTGLLASAANVRAVARWIDRLREQAPVALVIDPVLGATTGAAFADAATLEAYRTLLLPRATAITPNRREAARLAGAEPTPAGGGRTDDVPALARRLRAAGAGAVCVTGGDDAATDGAVLDPGGIAVTLALDWIDCEPVAGWLALPRVDTPHNHGTGCTFATAAAAALALGHDHADAFVLAKLATTWALARGYAAGAGAGPVHAQPGFADDPALLPLLSTGDPPRFAAAALAQLSTATRRAFEATRPPRARLEPAGARPLWQQCRERAGALAPLAQ